MNERVDKLTAQATELTRDEKLDLIERILATVHPTAPAIDAAWIEEAEERMAAYERGEVETYDADEVLEELRKRPRTKR